MKIQKDDGSIVYDSLELECNAIDKPSIVKLNTTDTLQSIHTKAVSNDVYNKAAIDLKVSSLIGAAPAVLNTRVERATAVGNDLNYATTIQN